MKSRLLVVLLGIAIAGSVIFAVTFQISTDDSQVIFESPFKEEYYEIQITGMKKMYHVGEQYDFSYILSGYGDPCGSKSVNFPDQDGVIQNMRTSASCAAEVSLRDFSYDIQKERGTTYGHVKLKNPGTYNVTVSFEKLKEPAVFEFEVMSKETCSIQCLVYDPVCGKDGVTYGCGVEDAACHGAEVDYNGECNIPATSSYMEEIIPTLDDFKDTLFESHDIDTIFSKFGKPHDDIGSGIHIYVYELNDSTEIWIGYIDHILYIKHVDSNGIILEELFVEN